MKSYNPVTPSQRNRLSVPYRKYLTVNEPHKALTTGFRRGSGRNAFGRITTRHKGAGHKRNYREVDFIYDKKDIPARIETVEYDPNRTAFISLVCYRDGERRYVVSSKNTKVGTTFIVSETAPVTYGNRTTLKNIPVGTFVYNVELKPGAGAKLDDLPEIILKSLLMTEDTHHSNFLHRKFERCRTHVGHLLVKFQMMKIASQIWVKLDVHDGWVFALLFVVQL